MARRIPKIDLEGIGIEQKQDIARPESISPLSTADLFLGSSRAKHLPALIGSEDAPKTLVLEKRRQMNHG